MHKNYIALLVSDGKIYTSSKTDEVNMDGLLGFVVLVIVVVMILSYLKIIKTSYLMKASLCGVALLISLSFGYMIPIIGWGIATAFYAVLYFQTR